MDKLCLLLCLCSTALLGQTEVPQSRWMTSFAVGMDLARHNQMTAANAAMSDKSTRQITLAQHFRLSRWLDLGLQVGFQRSSLNGARDFIDESTGLVVLSNWISLRKNLMLGLQPRVNYRIGQGDLALAPGVGVVHHRNLTSFRSPELGRADFRATPMSDLYFDLNLSYTYWPTTRFGLLFSISYVALQHQGNAASTDEAGNYIFTSQNFINTTQAFAPESFQFPVAPSRNTFLNLGLVHRW